MASEVDIANMALGYLGDPGNVTSLSPPDGSVQAGLCARFLPIARNAMLELYPWNFATLRVDLALLSVTPPSSWKYAYAAPSDVINVLGIYDPDASDDVSQGLVQPYSVPGTVPPAVGSYTPQPYTIEKLTDGTEVVYTNQENAVMRYTTLVTDTSKFPPLFIEALAWSLASKLSGPLLKGDTGRKVSQDCLKTFLVWFGQATESDANQRRLLVAQRTPWMANR